MDARNLAQVRNLAQNVLSEVEKAKRQYTEIKPSYLKYLKQEGSCGLRYKEQFVEKTMPPPLTENELKRRVLLFHALDTIPPQCNGWVPELKRLKNDGVSAEEGRLIDHGQQFKDCLGGYGMEIVERFYEYEFAFDHQTLLADHFDVVAKDTNGEMVIIRFEVTSNLRQTFKPLNGDYGWGNYHLRDHTLAYLSMLAAGEVLGERPRFFYWLAETRSMDYDFIEIHRDALRMAETQQAIRDAQTMADKFKKENYVPNGEFRHCESCPHIRCNERVTQKPIKTVTR